MRRNMGTCAAAVVATAILIACGGDTDTEEKPSTPSNDCVDETCGKSLGKVAEQPEPDLNAAFEGIEAPEVRNVPEWGEQHDRPDGG